MLVCKRTLPSIPGGLMNRAFVYTSAANTDVRRTFDAIRGAQVMPVSPVVQFRLSGSRQA